MLGVLDCGAQRRSTWIREQLRAAALGAIAAEPVHGQCSCFPPRNAAIAELSRELVAIARHAPRLVAVTHQAARRSWRVTFRRRWALQPQTIATQSKRA